MVSNTQSKLSESNIPPHVRESLARYIDHGVKPGDCVRSILENRLVEAFIRADDDVARSMQDIARFLYMHAPSPCWGSSTKVDYWLSIGGWSGMTNGVENE